MMCYRCEWRALFLETGQRPRHECGDGGSKIACYMYKPVKPIFTVKLDKNDKRPRFVNAMIACREKFDSKVECDLNAHVEGDKVALYWVPKT